MKQLLLLILITNYLTAMEYPFEKFTQDYPFYNPKQLKELFSAVPRDIQKILARSFHEAHGWHALADGSCYLAQEDIQIGHHQMHCAHPWRLLHLNGKLLLQFDDPHTHKLKTIMTVPCNQHQVPCEQYKVIGPNFRLLAVVRNQFIDINNPHEPVPLPLDQLAGEKVMCIHPHKSICATFDLAGTLRVYWWAKKRLIKIKKLETHATGDVERKHKFTQLSFNAQDYLCAVDGQIMRIIDFERDVLIAQLKASMMAEHEHEANVYFTDSTWCPKKNNLLLLSYRAAGPEKPEFLGELISDRRHHYVFYDVQTQRYFPLQIHRGRAEPRVLWNKSILSYKKRRIHLCEEYSHIENPESLSHTLVSIKTPEEMLATLKKLLDRNTQSESNRDLNPI